MNNCNSQRIGLTIFAALTGAIILFQATIPGSRAGEQPEPGQQAAKVQTIRVSKEIAPIQTEIVGTVQAVNSAAISAKITGNIVRLPVELGTRVQKGALLVELQADEIAAQLDQATAQLNQARRNLQREETLLKKNAATPESVKNLRDQLKIAEASQQEAQIMRSYTRIVAPFTGIITKKSANIGDLATPGKILLHLEDETRLQVVTDFPEKMMLEIERGDRMTIRIPSFNGTMEAMVAEVSPIADPKSRTVKVKLDLPEDPRLRSGQFARVSITSDAVRTILVPGTAVSRYGQMERVFVARDQTAHLRLVRTGMKHGDRVEILSGLTPGEEVILFPPQQLTEGQPIDAAPSSL